MKIAIPTRGSRVDEHFGHCETYTIVSVDDRNRITGSEKLPSPQGCGCKSDIAAILKQNGVSVMLAGNMGAGALNVLNMHGIEVIRGCSGDVTTVAEDFLSGKLIDSGLSCAHHEQHHSRHERMHQCGNDRN